MDIGKKIKSLRTQRGNTQETLAQALQVSPQAVSKWENGITMPDVQLLPQISAHFGITLDELFELSDDLRLERIQNMLQDERELNPDTVRTETAFLLDRAKREPEDAQALALLAEMENHQAKTHSRDAAEYAKKALARDPQSKHAHSELVQACGGKIRDWYYDNHHELINWYKDFVRKHPDYRGGYLWLLDQLLDDQRLDEASEYVEQMAAIDTTCRTPLYRGHIAWQQGKRKEALAIWQAMCDTYQEDWITWLSMGDVMAQTGEYEKAIIHYRKAFDIQPQPKMVDALESIAQVEELRGRYPQAIQALEEEIETLRAQWNTHHGETLDSVFREIQRLKKLTDASSTFSPYLILNENVHAQMG